MQMLSRRPPLGADRQPAAILEYGVDVKRPSGGFARTASSVHASANAVVAADRRSGMTKRIEQSRRHGHSDPRWVGRVQTESNPPPTDAPPRLRLVGGTDVTPEPVDPPTVRAV